MDRKGDFPPARAGAGATGEIEEHWPRLLDLLGSYRSVAVAVSGGVDSALLLKAACEVHGEVCALHARSPLQRQRNEAPLAALCAGLGVVLRIVEYDPFTLPGFVANGPERCYLCKRLMYSRFLDLLPAGTLLLDGTNRDDLSRERPGLRAIAELGVKKPLAEIGFCKLDVRSRARELGLPQWDLPSDSCLATRIRSGVALHPWLAAAVEAVEDSLADSGMRDFRVCFDGENVAVSLARDSVSAQALAAIRKQLGRVLAKYSCPKVFLELSG